MACEYPLRPRQHAMPAELVKDLRIEIDRGEGEWETVLEMQNNRKRLLELPLNRRGQGIRLTLQSSWGDADPRLFSIDLLHKPQDDTVHFPQGKTWSEVVAALPPEELLPPDTQAVGKPHTGHGA